MQSYSLSKHCGHHQPLCFHPFAMAETRVTPWRPRPHPPPPPPRVTAAFPTHPSTPKSARHQPGPPAPGSGRLHPVTHTPFSGQSSIVHSEDDEGSSCSRCWAEKCGVQPFTGLGGESPIRRGRSPPPLLSALIIKNCFAGGKLGCITKSRHQLWLFSVFCCVFFLTVLLCSLQKSVPAASRVQEM